VSSSGLSARESSVEFVSNLEDSESTIKTPRRYFGVREWEDFVEMVYDRQILDGAHGLSCAEPEAIERLARTTKCRRKFEAFVWLTLHYFFQATALPQKNLAREQLNFLREVWVRGDMEYGKRNPDAVAVGRKMTVLGNDRNEGSSDDEVWMKPSSNRSSQSLTPYAPKGVLLGPPRPTQGFAFDKPQGRRDSFNGLSEPDTFY